MTTLLVTAGWQLAARGHPWLDRLGAVGVAGPILLLAYRLFRRAVPVLIDRVAIDSESVRRVAREVDGVRSVEDVCSRSIGSAVAMDLVIRVSADLPTADSHAIVEQVEHRVRSRLAVSDVTVFTSSSPRAARGRPVYADATRRDPCESSGAAAPALPRQRHSRVFAVVESRAGDGPARRREGRGLGRVRPCRLRRHGLIRGCSSLYSRSPEPPAMSELKYLGSRYAVDGYDTVLKTLQKNGQAVPFACRGGHCHACLMKATAGRPMPFSQMGLDQALIDEGYFLACRCMIYADMEVSLPDEEEITRITDR